ncbi:MAG: hypothetical protein K9K64_16055, partial [Desulfohalobiaceae bacterium]|nr:hypothetical protein [Desulfohalobiaceae bacterium]
MPDSDTPQRWQIIQELAERLGRPMPCSSAEDIFAEMAALTPYYQGMSHSRLEGDGICWPCPSPDHPGTRYLHKDRFVHGKGRFHG